MKLAISEQVTDWRTVPEGALFQCQSGDNQFFGMKISSSDMEACLLLYGQRPQAPTPPAVISFADLLNEPLLMFPEALLIPRSPASRIDTRRSSIPKLGDLV